MNKQNVGLKITIEAIKELRDAIRAGDDTTETLSCLAGLYESLNLDFIAELTEETRNEHEDDNAA